ncbi:type II toxin-antitoxin system RelE family toxin [Thiobaca trueperi]|uniref:mRNA interferase RelE/StbE n=1 Tax=Thiobaca trueperi TaxID=127458 RepID=A0A4R3NA37_9GAMM|nr:type II toxin-antitoxin system RelE/ParE family toxin [Thiobaca trueperi]TCT23859.1 mRNA interferase RelE/StbE [Thiobaca trueperi]
MAWRIDFERGAERDLRKLDPPVARRILSFLHQRLALLDDPRTLGEALQGSRLGAFWKYRVGDYRLVATIQDDTVCILILQVGHRREIYRDH